uniref:Uncharacterized protein n=1 Tax=Myotis myotis TaxID=51298 RepID=A0A7J7UCT5_MYOMY|nr:hypothetical protein mMyoMyo1_008743 [Myotis myotis]
MSMRDGSEPSRNCSLSSWQGLQDQINRHEAGTDQNAEKKNTNKTGPRNASQRTKQEVTAHLHLASTQRAFTAAEMAPGCPSRSHSRASAVQQDGSLHRGVHCGCERPSPAGQAAPPSSLDRRPPPTLLITCLRTGPACFCTAYGTGYRTLGSAPSCPLTV